MSARDDMIQEIKLAPESLAREAYDFMLFLKSRRVEESGASSAKPLSLKPDFLARQEARFGSRVVADSQMTLDQLREERH